jgi:hypothetical protein
MGEMKKTRCVMGDGMKSDPDNSKRLRSFGVDVAVQAARMIKEKA